MRLPPIPELASPLPLAAVAILAVNGHLLKRAWPGALTGKLPDLAGCFVLPRFLSALLAVVTCWPRRVRLALGAAATAVFFSALELSQPAADAVARALGVAWPLRGAPGRIVADPTDLVALPLAAAALLFGLRAGRALPEETA